MTTYSITETNGCRLVTGPVPLASFAMLCHGMPDDAVADTHAARLLGVTFAFGTRAALDALTSDPIVLAATRSRANARSPALSQAAKEWLATGEQGTSSQTIFQRLTGVKLTEDESHPLDPADLRRCRFLLEQVPELLCRLPEMAGVSEQWRRLVEDGTSLCGTMDAECPAWRSGTGEAKETARLMRAMR